MVAYSQDTNELVQKSPDVDSLFTVASITKIIVGLTACILNQELENTKGEFQLNTPVGKVENSNSSQINPIKALENTKYRVLKLTSTTQQLVVPPGRVAAGDHIVRALVDKTIGDTSIVTGSYYFKSELDTAGFASGVDYDINVPFELVEPKIPLTPAHMLSQTTGQALINNVNNATNSPEYSTNFEAQREIINLMYNSNYPDACGLEACTAADPAPTQTSILITDPGQASYGEGMSVFGYYMIQCLYAKNKDILSSDVTYTDIINAGYDLESILYKYVVKPIQEYNPLIKDSDCYFTKRKLLDPNGSGVTIRPELNVDNTRFFPPTLLVGSPQYNAFYNFFASRVEGNPGQDGIYYDGSTNIVCTHRFLIEFAQLILRRGQKDNSYDPLIDIETPFVNSKYPVMEQFMWERHVTPPEDGSSYGIEDFFESALTISGLPYNWGHASAYKEVYNGNGSGYAQIGPIISITGAFGTILLIYPDLGLFTLINYNSYVFANKTAISLFKNMQQKTLTNVLFELNDVSCRLEQAKINSGFIVN